MFTGNSLPEIQILKIVKTYIFMNAHVYKYESSVLFVLKK